MEETKGFFDIRVDLFITNDNHLHGNRVAGAQFIEQLDRVPV